MKSLKILALALVVALAFGSCATTFQTTNGKLAYADISGTDKGSFEVKANAISVISPYLIPITKPYAALNDLIDPALAEKGANAARDVRIKYGFDALGLVITSFTGGFLNWNYVSVSGNAISR
ncbi:MAG: hypothetical protein JXA15_05425 [Spirochaetales bacterium]|nr:hypothetical protein [Spirochaetales bacterium]